MADRNYLVKEFHITVLGSSAVGKSSLIQQYVKSCFPDDYNPTYEANYRKDLMVGSIPCALEIIDTAGQEHNPTLLNSLISKADGFLLVFDLTYAPSFDELQNYRERIMDVKASQRARKVSYIIVGNKLDIETQRAVSTAKGRALAEKWGCSYVEISARTKANLDEMFSIVIRMIIDSRHPPQAERACCRLM